MIRVWFNHWFSTSYRLIELMKENEGEQVFVVGTNKQYHSVFSSLYGEDRRIFVYDIGAYDAVIVMTDAQQKLQKGELSLLNAVRAKNEVVYLVRWCK